MNIQFCRDGQDITGDFYAAEDTTEVRAWTEDGTCLGAVTQDTAGRWHASASDVADWVTRADLGYRTWQLALAPLLAVSGHELPAGL